MDFCAIYETAVYRIARKYGLQDADAREVSQEVLLRVSRRIATFNSSKSGRFRAWLATVARNSTIDLIRNRPRERTLDLQSQASLDRLSSSDNELKIFIAEEQREQFRWAAESVRACESELNWQAFWLTSVEGLSGKSVAQQLGMSVGAVYVARCRTLAKIKKLIEPFRGDAS
jgi:RNA polymerase sigma-70 factor (ECF subfamily)